MNGKNPEYWNNYILGTWIGKIINDIIIIYRTILLQYRPKSVSTSINPSIYGKRIIREK